jgi:ABC-type Na+ efflux pump permease subunit
MSSFADLFNPSFFIFLGILVLLGSLLVVYFESKNREQTQKITAMFSVVSSLADEVNYVKNVLTQISYQGDNSLNGGNSHFQENILEISENDLQKKNILISVSDDDEDDVEEDDDSSEDEEGEELDLESVDSSSSDSSEELEESLEQNNVKVLKINSTNDNDNDLKMDDLDHDINLDDDLQSISSESELDTEQPEVLNISSSEFKTININLDESPENIDYKKFSLPKLKSIVVEKGLAEDASKLKKSDLLKLLGVE